MYEVNKVTNPELDFKSEQDVLYLGYLRRLGASCLEDLKGKDLHIILPGSIQVFVRPYKTEITKINHTTPKRFIPRIYIASNKNAFQLNDGTVCRMKDLTLSRGQVTARYKDPRKSVLVSVVLDSKEKKVVRLK